MSGQGGVQSCMDDSLIHFFFFRGLKANVRTKLLHAMHDILFQICMTHKMRLRAQYDV